MFLGRSVVQSRIGEAFHHLGLPGSAITDNFSARFLEVDLKHQHISKRTVSLYEAPDLGHQLNGFSRAAIPGHPPTGLLHPYRSRPHLRQELSELAVQLHEPD